MIIETKKQYPQCRHRQIQGLIQNAGAYLSASSVYNVLKERGLVEPFSRRESPFKKPRYEVYRRNLMWGADWTKIKIAHQSWHFLTLIDFYSRFIVAYMIVPEVNSGHIKFLYQQGLSSQELIESSIKPKLRVDQGSPNTSIVTREFFIGMALDLLSLARIRRPTDNAITERFYGTVKQEEIYIVGSYPDAQSANEELGRYINFYNYERPHQALWNFTPAKVHNTNNKSSILAELEELKFMSKRRRREYWALWETVQMQQKIKQCLPLGRSLDYTLNNSILSKNENA